MLVKVGMSKEEIKKELRVKIRPIFKGLPRCDTDIGIRDVVRYYLNVLNEGALTDFPPFNAKTRDEKQKELVNRFQDPKLSVLFDEKVKSVEWTQQSLDLSKHALQMMEALDIRSLNTLDGYGMYSTLKRLEEKLEKLKRDREQLEYILDIFSD